MRRNDRLETARIASIYHGRPPSQRALFLCVRRGIACPTYTKNPTASAQGALLQRIIFPNGSRPVVGLFDQLKFHGWPGIINAIEMNLAQEKADLVVSVTVQPFNRGAVFFARVLHNPYDHIGVFAGCIGYQLAQMIVIGVLKLIFDDDFSTRSGLSRHNIGAEITDGRFRFIGGYFHARRPVWPCAHPRQAMA